MVSNFKNTEIFARFLPWLFFAALGWEAAWAFLSLRGWFSRSTCFRRVVR